MPTSRQIHLAARPRGVPSSGFRARRGRRARARRRARCWSATLFMSVDPYMRGRMNDAKSYVPPFELGEPLDGGAVGEVVASATPRRRRSATWVVARPRLARVRALGRRRARPLVDPQLGARRRRTSECSACPASPRTWACSTSAGRRRARPSSSPARPAPWAAWPARSPSCKGCRVIGSAGSAEKVAWLRELGFDAAFDYNDGPVGPRSRGGARRHRRVLRQRRRRPPGGGASARLRAHGRVALCGAISQYNATEPPPGPRNLALVVGKRLRCAASSSPTTTTGGRLPRRGRAAGCATAGFATARRSSTASRTLRPRSSGCCAATTPARCSSGWGRDHEPRLPTSRRSSVQCRAQRRDIGTERLRDPLPPPGPHGSRRRCRRPDRPPRGPAGGRDSEACVQRDVRQARARASEAGEGRRQLGACAGRAGEGDEVQPAVRLGGGERDPLVGRGRGDELDAPESGRAPAAGRR